MAKRRGHGGRPRTREAEPGEKITISVRVTQKTRERLEEWAAATGRSLSQEAELRLERSFDREELLPEVLSLAYGREAAGLLMALGLLMVRVGEQFHVANGGAEGGKPWTSNPTTMAYVADAVLALFDAAQPGVDILRSRGTGIEAAMQLIKALDTPTGRGWFMADSRTVAATSSLLGPMTKRMVKAAAKRPLIGLGRSTKYKQDHIRVIADVLADLVSKKNGVPTEQEIFEALDQCFPPDWKRESAVMQAEKGKKP